VEILNYSCKSWKIRWIRDGNDWVWVKGLPFSSSDGFECITVFLSLSFTTTNWEYLWLSCFPYWVVVRATQGKQYVNSKVLHKCEDLDLLEMRLIFSFFPKYLPATYRIQKFYTYLILREERERERDEQMYRWNDFMLQWNWDHSSLISFLYNWYPKAKLDASDYIKLCTQKSWTWLFHCYCFLPDQRRYKPERTGLWPQKVEQTTLHPSCNYTRDITKANVRQL
jgi:hypothetical protein